MNNSKATVWTIFYFLLFYALTFPALKLNLGIEVRLGQLLLLAIFVVLFLRDFQYRQVGWHVLLPMVVIALLFSLMSTSSPYPKVKEIQFIVKYLAIYPAAFYVGWRIYNMLGVVRLILILEATLFLACLGAVLLHINPIPLLIHERPAHLSIDLKGSFWEQGGFAFFIGLFSLAAITLRVEFSVWPKKRTLWIAMYVFVLGCALASKNKTVWVGLLGSLILTGVLFVPAQTKKNVGILRRINSDLKVWSKRFILLAVVASVFLFTYNQTLAPNEKIVSKEMLEHKWESERGAALRAALGLIEEDPVLGKGFGFVEAYFGSHNSEIIGLGAGVGQIFNSYLDLWVSMGLLGVIYALALLIFCFDKRSFFSVMMVSYLFIWANFNPVAQSEYYFIFLGICYAALVSRRIHQVPFKYVEDVSASTVNLNRRV